MAELKLYSTFEDIQSEFVGSTVNEKLMEFVEPLSEYESEINEIASSLSSSGKMLFILGRPGTGKSTFIQSLGWRPHIKIRSMQQIDANQFIQDGAMDGLYDHIASFASDAKQFKDAGPTCIVVNYLENLAEFSETDVKGFFRRLNGLLRNAPIFVIWPVTERSDVDQMLEYSKGVSGTLFYRTKEVLDFAGPRAEKFVDITKRTIAVLNDGKDLSEFSLTNDDLEEVFAQFKKIPSSSRTLREYIELTKERWRTASGHQERLRKKIPKSTEVWFIFSYKDAESVVGQFIRKSHRVEDAWSAIHDKLFEYIHQNTQRSSVWDAKRLQLALYGALKTRIMFLPTNTLISCVAAYTDNESLRSTLDAAGVPVSWKNRKDAKRSLEKTPLFKQLLGESFHVGFRKGGPAAEALVKAEPLFAEMVKWIASASGSDKPVNKCVAMALAECTQQIVEQDKPHPWIPNIIPDLFIDTPHTQICVEFHHTNRDRPNVIADYVLKKLDVYMNQIDVLLKQK